MLCIQSITKMVMLKVSMTIQQTSNSIRKTTQACIDVTSINSLLVPLHRKKLESTRTRQTYFPANLVQNSQPPIIQTV